MEENLLDDVDIRILMNRHLVIYRKWNYKNLCDSFWRLYYNSQDGATVLLKNGPFHLTKQRVHIIPAWIPFDCFCKNPVDHYFISFDLIGFSKTMVQEIFNQPLTLKLDRYTENLAKEWVYSLKKSQSTGLFYFLRLKAFVYLALSNFISQLPLEKQVRCNRRIQWRYALLPALDYIEQNIAGELSNSVLASSCNLSVHHFRRTFRLFSGQTPAQYVRDQRLRLAAQQLVFSDQKIDAIAEQCGFRDRFYFTRIFTKYMGLPPASYRRKDRT